jgi:hypothetical protein
MPNFALAGGVVAVGATDGTDSGWDGALAEGSEGDIVVDLPLPGIRLLQIVP